MTVLAVDFTPTKTCDACGQLIQQDEQSAYMNKRRHREDEPTLWAYVHVKKCPPKDKQ